jgi:RNA polymerase sigma-70 factor (ECF subfamily)
VSHDSEREKFMVLVDDHGAALLALVRRLCGNPHDADDVFQETAVRVWRGLSSSPEIQNPRSWLLTIGYRTFLDARGRRGRFESLAESDDRRESSPAELASQAETAALVNAAITRLPATLREVVVLHYTGGLTLSETAAAMNLSEGTVKSRLNAALHKLRSELE